MNTAEKDVQPTEFEYKGFKIFLEYHNDSFVRGWTWNISTPLSLLDLLLSSPWYSDYGDTYEGAIADAKNTIDQKLKREIDQRKNELQRLEAHAKREVDAPREIVWRARNRVVVKAEGGFIALTPESGAALPGVYAELAGAIAAYEIDLAALDYAALDKDEPSLTLDDLRFYWSRSYGCADVNLSREQVEVILQKAIAIANRRDNGTPD